MRGTTGAASILTGWMLDATGNGEPVIVVVGVTLVACTFGMLSSLSRVKQTALRDGGVRALALNAGAVWTAALVLSFRSEAALSGCALIGLGVGLAGTTILEVIERGAVAVAQRLGGIDTPVSKEEFHEKIGDVRQKAQVAISERRRDEKAAKPDEPEHPEP